LCMIEVRRTSIFADWFRALRDERAKARIQMRIARVELGLIGDVKYFGGIGSASESCALIMGLGIGSTLSERTTPSFFSCAEGTRVPRGATSSALRKSRRRSDMAIETKVWDAAEFLTTPAEVAAYLEAAFEDGDPALITHALGVIARAEGMSEVAKQTGLTRASLYKALSADGHPEFATVLKVMQALGLKMTVTA